MTSSRSRSGRRARRSTTGSSSPPVLRTISAYNAAFEQHLTDHGIYPDRHNRVEPNNLDEINRRLAQPRASLSPSRCPHEVFVEFREKNREALNESKVRSSVFPIVTGNARIPSQEQILFSNLAPLTDGNITQSKPDFYDGSRPEQLDRQVRVEFGSYIVPSAAIQHAPMLPNFFAELKGPAGRSDVAMRQACYDGAIGERAILHARSYASGDDAAYDGNAHTITSTYFSGAGTLMMYAVHATQPASSGNRPEYYMTQLGTWALTGSHTHFLEGVGALRNARDWAKEQRDNTIAMANERARNIQP